MLNPPDTAAGAPTVTHDQPRALVVDDNDMIRTLVSRLLRQDGHVVDTAASVAEALALPVADYESLIIDVRLGTERGTDLVERLRAQDPSMPARCLLLTGGTEDDLPSDVAVLLKPFSADDLAAAIHQLRAPRACPPDRAAGPSDPRTPPDPPPHGS